MNFRISRDQAHPFLCKEKYCIFRKMQSLLRYDHRALEEECFMGRRLFFEAYLLCQRLPFRRITIFNPNAQ